MGERSIIGSNDQLVDEFGRYAELGFDELIIPDFTLGGTRRGALREVRRAPVGGISQLA